MAELTPNPNPTPSPDPSGDLTPKLPEFIGQAIQAAPEDVRAKLQEFKGWDRHKDLPGLLQSYVESQSMVGKIKGGQYIEKPGEGALPAQWDKVYAQLGRPENVEGYKAAVEKVTAALPEGTEINPKVLSRTLAKAHAAGLNPNQLAAVMQEYLAASLEEVAAGAEAQTAALAENKQKVLDQMQKEYGASFKEKMAMSQEIVSMIFESDADPSVKFLRESGLDQDPRLARFLIKVADFAGPENIFGGRYRSLTLGEKSENDINARIKEIRTEMAKTDEKGVLVAKPEQLKVLQEEMHALYRERVERKGPPRQEGIAVVARG